MKNIVFILVGLLASSVSFAETALRDDGRKVRLNEDGSWEFVSDDVYATSESGLRVVLKADGRWQALAAPKSDIARQAVKAEGATNSYFNVDAIYIEKSTDGRGSNSKAKVYLTQSIIELSANKNLRDDQLVAQNFVIRDDKGGSYPVLKISRQQDTIRLIAEGSPSRWGRIKFYEVVVAKAVADSLSDIVLRYDYRDVPTKDVVELSE